MLLNYTYSNELTNQSATKFENVLSILLDLDHYRDIRPSLWSLTLALNLKILQIWVLSQNFQKQSNWTFAASTALTSQGKFWKHHTLPKKLRNYYFLHYRILLEASDKRRDTWKGGERQEKIGAIHFQKLETGERGNNSHPWIWTSFLITNNLSIHYQMQTIFYIVSYRKNVFHTNKNRRQKRRRKIEKAGCRRNEVVNWD